MVQRTTNQQKGSLIGRAGALPDPRPLFTMANSVAISMVGGQLAGGGGAPAAPAAVTISSAVSQLDWSDPSTQNTQAPDIEDIVITYTVPGGWTGTGVHCYYEDPDASSATVLVPDGTMVADGSKIAGGATWAPTDAGKFPVSNGIYQAIIKGLPISSSSRNVRVYVQPYNANSDPPPVRANIGGATTNTVVTIAGYTGGVTGPIGNEAAANIISPTANVQYVANGSGQWSLVLSATWTEPDDVNWAGVVVTLKRPPDTQQQVIATRRGGTAAGDPSSTLVSPVIFGNVWTVTLSHFPTATQYATLQFQSVNSQGVVNTYVQGVTPEIVNLEIDPPPVGNSGQEYCSLVAGFTAAIVYTTNADGVEVYGFSGTVAPPTDSQYGGFKVMAHNEADGSNHANDITLGVWGPSDTTWKTDTWPVGSGSTTWDLYCVSYDVNNNDNSLQPGVTPRVTGLVETAQTSGSLLGGRVVPGSIGTTQIASAAITDAKIANCNVNKLEAGTANFGGTATFQSGSSGPYVQISSTGISVSGGGTASVQITSTGITLTGTASISTASITGGSISGTSLTLNSNGITTTLNNGTSGGSGRAAGLDVTDGTYHGQVDKLGLYAYDSSHTSNSVSASVTSSGGYFFASAASGGQAQLDCGGSGTAGRLIINNNQIATVRQTGPGTPSFSSVSDAQTWCSNLLTALRTHGLVT